MNNVAETKKQSGLEPDPIPAKDRRSSLIERLVREEIEQRERGLLADWRAELSILQAGRS